MTQDKITTQEFYIKCQICKTEIKVFEGAYYKGYLNSDLQMINDNVCCSVKCLHRLDKEV